MKNINIGDLRVTKFSYMKYLLSIVFVLSIFFTGLQAETWKFATEADKKDVQDIFAQKFADVIKKESNGDIKTRIYYYGQLGTENDIVELTAKGVVNFVSVGTGHLGSYVPEVQAVGLPYVIGTDEEIAREVLTSSKAIYNYLAEKFEKANLKLLTMFSEGEMVWGANKAIRSPKDFAGQKIRTFTSTIPVKTYQTFGAIPTPLSWGEVYSALQLKTIDGMVNPIYFIYNAKWYEVQDYLMYPGQQPYISTISTNSKWYNKLPRKKKAMIDKAILAAEQAAHDYQIKINAENMVKILKEKPDMQVIVLTEKERQVFKELSGDLHEIFYDVVADAYSSSERAEARKGAKKLLTDLIGEVKQASK